MVFQSYCFGTVNFDSFEMFTAWHCNHYKCNYFRGHTVIINTLSRFTLNFKLAVRFHQRNIAFFSLLCLLSYFFNFLPSQDIDECFNKTVSKCAQTCVNSPGSFSCDCNKGYELDANKRDCNGKILWFTQ